MDAKPEKGRLMDEILDILAAEFHRNILQGFFSIIKELPSSSYSLDIHQTESKTVQVKVAPKVTNSACLELELLNDVDEVSIRAGIAACLHIPTDLHGDDLLNPTDFLIRTIDSILRGRFTESLYYHKNDLVKNVLQLSFFDRPSFAFSRRSLGATLKSLGRSMERREMAYESYFA